MNIQSVRNKITAYINNAILSDEHYSNLLISANIEETTHVGEVIFESNAKITMIGSQSAETKIKKYVQDELLDTEITFGIKIAVVFSQKHNSKESRDVELTKFFCEIPKHDLSDVVMSQEKYEEIQNALSLIKNYELVYADWGWSEKEPAAKTIMCFYGAPGTGKTMCAHGIAKHLGKKILIASYADIQSEYVGVGPKNLKAIFAQAQENDAVLFFDEADSFLRKRTSDTSSSAAMHYNSMTNEMMKHLEDFNGLVIFATNLTENTDEAFKTRITCSVEFVVPDEHSRAKIISYMIPSAVPLVHDFSSDDYLTIAKACEGFVGRDIRNAVKAVLTEGARLGTYPFSVDSFVSGFEHYKETKDRLEESIDGKNGGSDDMSPVDKFTENGRILSLLSYVAWIDGEENDKETEILKEKAKLFGRNKIIIRKLTDLPPLEEICEGISHDKMKLQAMLHVSDVLAVSGEDVTNLATLYEITSLLGLGGKNKSFEAYYNIVRQRYSIVEAIASIEKV